MTYKGGSYDVIVVGAGHAGCEAALASARMGQHTLLLTLNMDGIAMMACNPAIGGTAKGHLVREIDALGGEMGLNADKTFIQIKMLNVGKGAAVHSLRAQMDKKNYQTEMKWTLENTENLEVRQGEAERILTKGGKVCGIVTACGAELSAKAVVLATGVYLKSKIIIGEYSANSGPSGLSGAYGLSASLLELGIRLQRFKTGTPARIDRRSIDFSKCIPQYGDEKIVPFSFLNTGIQREQVLCHLTYTNEKTHEIIRENLHRSPMYSGVIEGIGPRYCPSIEDKVVRFADKKRHQLFLEPEGLRTNEIYVQGMSSSLPEEVQIALYRTIPGLENCKFIRTAYAIEYDCIDPTQLNLSLQMKNIPGLFMAGQINGSSGYEEAGGQGIIAGINAVQYIRGEQSVVLGRDQAYIGVLIDDLVTKGTSEPYRMMTSRAEYRLLLRQDNADRRLTALGYEYGSVSEERYQKFLKKKANVDAELARIEKKTVSNKIQNEFLSRHGSAECDRGLSFGEMMRRPEIHYADTAEIDDETRPELTRNERYEVEVRIKYDGYIQKQIAQVEKMKKLESKRLDDSIDYNSIGGLRLEARQKLTEIRPINLGQASRISGVSPADINVLLVYLEKENRKRSTNE